MTRSPTVRLPSLMPCAVSHIAEDSAMLKITDWPKLRAESVYCVFRAASSYSAAHYPSSACIFQAFCHEYGIASHDKLTSAGQNENSRDYQGIHGIVHGLSRWLDVSMLAQQIRLPCFSVSGLEADRGKDALRVGGVLPNQEEGLPAMHSSYRCFSCCSLAKYLTVS